MVQLNLYTRPKNPAILELENMALAWQAFTALKLPRRWISHIESTPKRAEASLRYVPLVGVILGGLAALAYWGAYNLFLSYNLAVLIGLSVPVILTAAFHERGLAALYKDNTAGGTITTVIIFLLKWQALMIIPACYAPWALIAAAAFSRFAGVSYILGRTQVTGSFVLAAAFGILPFVLFGRYTFVLLVPILWAVRDAAGWLLMKHFGRHEGHSLDAVQQIVELGLYLGVAIIVRFHWA